jgi:hypothetical protein
MEITLEQVKKLQEHAHVSFKEAKEALTETDGNLLEALIALEENGKVNPDMGSSESSADGAESAYGYGQQRHDHRGHSHHGQGQHGCGDYGEKGKGSFMALLKKGWDKLCELVHKGNINHFEVWRQEERVVDIPVNVLIVCLIFFFWFICPALVIALFFGCRYRFRGPDLGREGKGINRAMDAAAEKAEDLKRNLQESENSEDKVNLGKE